MPKEWLHVCDVINNRGGTPRAKTIIPYKMVSLKELIRGYIVCPNQTVQLKCDKNKRIEIFRADYGRQHLSMCGRGSTTNCSTDRTTTTKMKELCENKATCRAQAVQGHFKDACPGETKYLDVAYKCKKKKGVSPVQRRVKIRSLSIDDMDSARSAILLVADDLSLIGKGAKNNATKPRNLNKFHDVIDQLERAMGQAQLSRKLFKLSDLKNDIKEAVNSGNLKSARRALGLALYTASQLSSKSRRHKRSMTEKAKTFLAEIKKELGAAKFSKLLALDGEVTLVFAVDITGSMQDEIDAAKAIVSAISKYERSQPVDYILSTFGDPKSQGSIVYKAEGEVDEFIKEIDKLVANGGGDCAEFTYDGMINALYEDPKLGSPLFVFTDAPPKDATEDNKNTLQVLADDLGVTVNFFATQGCTWGPYKLEDFKQLAKRFSGQFFELEETEIGRMISFTRSSLGGLNKVAEGKKSTGTTKRSTTNQVAIPVDDTVSGLVVTVTTANSPNGISLITPTGKTWTEGKTTLSKVVGYNINSPLIKGMWKLLVPSSVGNYGYSAEVSSSQNIDFKHHYTKYYNKKLIQIRNPLAGELAIVNIIISDPTKVEKSSLTIDIIDTSGKTLISNKKLISVGKSGSRFSFSFRPPNKPFKLMLKGKTTGNSIFQRISRHVGDAQPLVLKEFYNSGRNKIKQGGSATIILYLFNSSNRDQRFEIVFKDTLGYQVSLPGRQTRKVRAKRRKFIRVSVRYSGGKLGRVGQTENVIIIVKAKDCVTTEVVPLMIAK